MRTVFMMDVSTHLWNKFLNLHFLVCLDYFTMLAFGNKYFGLNFFSL